MNNDRKVEEALAVQDALKNELSLESFLLDKDADKKREEEHALGNICERLLLSEAELKSIVEKGERGEAAKQILAKVESLTRELAEKAQITYGEKRYLEGLREGLAEYFERKTTLDAMEKRLCAMLEEIRRFYVAQVRGGRGRAWTRRADAIAEEEPHSQCLSPNSLYKAVLENKKVD
jgi:hypothetical protein